MPRPMYNTLADLERGFANARTSANRSQLKKKARELARALRQPEPAWAVAAGTHRPSTLPPLPDALVRWRDSHRCSRVLRVRGGIALDNGRGVIKNFPTVEAAVAAVS